MRLVGRSRRPTGPHHRRERETVSEHLLEVKGAFKHFGAVQALRGANLHADVGTVMALVGDNGAGKTVLTKSISGIYQLDEGEVLWEGTPVTIAGPKDSARLGIEVVYQDLALCDNLDVVENMYLGRETRSSFRRLDEAKMEAETRRVLRDLSVTTLQSVRLPVAAMSGGQRQSVAVAKAVLWNSKLVVLDEPTAALGVAQTRQVLDLTKRLATQGLAVILISHNMSDVFEVADYITVLRLGQTVAEFKRTETTQREVVEAITAGQLSQVPGMEGVVA
jgi:D-xylose transport system ATP-binding protein